MSIRAIDWAFHQECGNPLTKLVLIKLADNANDDGQCWPAMSYISTHCECSVSTVQRAIAKLKQMKLLEVVPRYAKNIQISSMYLLNIPARSHRLSARSHRPSRSVKSARSERPTESSSETVIEPKRQQAELKKIIDELALAKEWK